MREIRRIILHCTDSPNPSQRISDVRRWHLERGWKDVGYHYLICMDGLIQPGRPEEAIGAGVEGHNADSLHIALAGRDNFRVEQFDSLAVLLQRLKKKYPKSRLHGHREFNPGKRCPVFDYDWLLDFFRKIPV